MPQVAGETAAASRPAGRPPRPEELALMASLRDGPKAVAAGPIGRCVKRGWCRPLILEEDEVAAHGRAAVLYALTEAGASLIG